MNNVSSDDIKNIQRALEMEYQPILSVHFTRWERAKIKWYSMLRQTLKLHKIILNAVGREMNRQQAFSHVNCRCLLEKTRKND